jgi:DNA-binding CsgD family transcriptional regulator
VLATPLEERAIINDERVDSYIAQQEYEAERSICQLPVLKQEYERYLLFQLFDFRTIFALQESLVRLFAEFFYHSHASLKQLHDQTLLDLQQRVVAVSAKWQQKIQSMSFEDLHDVDFLERVKRSAEYFADQLRDILTKPIELTAKVETNNKQASRRLGNLLPDLRQAWLSRRYLLTKMMEQEFSVSAYLHEKQMSMLDALDEDALKTKRARKPKAPKPAKEPKPKTWEISLSLYKQGKTPENIAAERGLTLGTVFGHLSRYLKTGEVSLDALVLPEHQQLIMKAIRKMGVDCGATPIKNACPAEITFDEIRLMMTVY